MSRTAATTGFSLDPEERAALDEFQELVGLRSRTEALRRYFLADLPGVNRRLRALRASGLEPSDRPELDQVRTPEARDQVERMYGSTWDSDDAGLLRAAEQAPAFR